MNRVSCKEQINKFISKIYTGSLEDNLYYISILVIIAVILFYVLFNAFVEFTGLYILRECGMKMVFGIPCPGCGGTRALISIFKGRLLDAFCYNSFVVYCVAVYVVFFASHTVSKISNGRVKGLPFKSWYISVAVGILLIQYILKLILHFCGV